MICWLHMIRCKNDALYRGVTIDYVWRWQEHFKGIGARYILKHGFDKPVFLQEFDNKSEAMLEERFIKKQDKYYKEEMIKSELNILIHDPEKPQLDYTMKGYKGRLPWL